MTKRHGGGIGGATVTNRGVIESLRCLMMRRLRRSHETHHLVFFILYKPHFADRLCG